MKTLFSDLLEVVVDAVIFFQAFQQMFTGSRSYQTKADSPWWGGKTRQLHKVSSHRWDRRKGKGSVRVRGELVMCWKQPVHSQISRIRKENLKVEMETRYEERTEQIRGGWQGKSVRYQENLFCPTIL